MKFQKIKFNINIHEDRDIENLNEDRLSFIPIPLRVLLSILEILTESDSLTAKVLNINVPGINELTS